MYFYINILLKGLRVVEVDKSDKYVTICCNQSNEYLSPPFPHSSGNNFFHFIRTCLTLPWLASNMAGKGLYTFSVRVAVIFLQFV